jgi:hypothetical protein
VKGNHIERIAVSLLSVSRTLKKRSINDYFSSTLLNFKCS